MSKRHRPKEPKRRSRVLMIDGSVYRVVYQNQGIIFAEILLGEERAMALQMLDDCHFEIDAHLDGNRSR